MGITQWISDQSVFLLLAEVTIAEALREQGYATGYIGKWHLRILPEHRPDQQGFDWIRAVSKAGRPSTYFAPYSGSNPFYDIPDLQDDQKGTVINPRPPSASGTGNSFALNRATASNSVT